ncbi:MAG TPA: hypothetical protein VKE98_14655 [Gemmataceae bacterium]|nr:hypothetical protein [Gemmataceae bacterium]
MNTNATLARVEEAYRAVNSLLQTSHKGLETQLIKRAKKHLRAALCDLILSQEILARPPQQLLACTN